MVHSNKEVPGLPSEKELHLPDQIQPCSTHDVAMLGHFSLGQLLHNTLSLSSKE